MLALVGCIRSQLVPCDNGLACPVGLVCDEVHAGCVTPEQLSTCVGLAELAACPVGICRDGVCLPVGCGNSRVDPGEACDDGNTSAADGCSADCSSTETCGNGVVDPVNRELCDDGDLVSHDGCDSRCLPEQPTWSELTQVAHPTRDFGAYAFDQARRRFVVFGGYVSDAVRSGATLEWASGSRTWLERTLLVSPTPRFGAAMTYDAARKVAVLFGGSDPSGLVSDTWEWDGDRWTQLASPVTPPRRIYHAMTYDQRRKRVVMFGGRNPMLEPLDETWEFDGATWTQITPGDSPPARERTMLAYDPLRDRVVVAGGIANGTARRDTWEFDGVTWTPGPPMPFPNVGGTLTFDPIRGGLVLATATAVVGVPSTYLFNGMSWQPIGPVATPLAQRSNHVAYFDPDLGTLVVGLGRRASEYPADLHVLGNAGWTALAADPGPVPLTSAAVTYDARRGRVVLFGGNDGMADRGETWEHDGNGWSLRTAISSPVGRDRAAIAYDHGRAVSVMWGARFTDDAVWEWTGGEWNSVTPTGARPPIRSAFALAYDDVSGCVVLFGGVDTVSMTMKYADTWTWDGMTWTDVTGTVSPPARSSHTLAYDPVRREVVLFGGSGSANNRLGDTWGWTLASGWTPRDPASAPSPRARHAMAVDPVRGELVVFGGTQASAPLAETWSWNGVTWLRVFAAVVPAAQTDAAMAYDASRGQMIAFGPAGTWRLEWSGSSAEDSCPLAIDRDGDALVGCADSDCDAFCAACGDGVSDPLETCRACPSDVGACVARCGDLVCDPSEVCPGDCGP